MTDDLTTATGIEAVLAATARYAVDRDVTLAQRRAAALERKLDFAQSAGRDGQDIRFDMGVIQSQLNRVYAFIQAHESLTDAQRLANPNVTHGDFSTFGPYAGGGNDYSD